MFQTRYNKEATIGHKTITWLSILAGIGAITTIGQIGYLAIYNRAFCVNQGCEIVESLLNIPPTWLNIAGALYFITIFSAVIIIKINDSCTALQLMRTILICGIAAEGILVSYQAFVAQTFCSYCLFICGLIIIMNLLLGRYQIALSTMLLTTEFLLFSSLQFNPSMTKDIYIEHGTYAFKEYNNNTYKKLYLVFSKNCPHCQRVMNLANDSTQCNVHFNPIQTIDDTPLTPLKSTLSYSPRINRLLLKILGIETVPVLLEERPDGFKIIKGEKDISLFLKTNCYSPANNRNESFDLSSLGFTSSDECKMNTDCNDISESSTSPHLK